jgi:dUTP pyrophosphatase
MKDIHITAASVKLKRQINFSNGECDGEGKCETKSSTTSCNDPMLCECYHNTRPYYKLFVYLESEDQNLIEKYETNFKKQRDKVNIYLQNSKICVDAGIDIFCKEEIVACRSNSCGGQGGVNKVKTGLKCAMYFMDKGDVIPSGFYMYTRSSTGSSTPLRLANSVGIIDAGYRGELMGCFDNLNTQYDYQVELYQRLLQICSPNLTYPIYPVMVSSLEELDTLLGDGTNDRGSGGFGSTGK